MRAVTSSYKMETSKIILQNSSPSTATTVSFKQRDFTQMDSAQNILHGLRKSEPSLDAKLIAAMTETSRTHRIKRSVSFNTEPYVYSYSDGPHVDYDSLYYKADDFNRFKKDLFDDMVRAEVEKRRTKKNTKRRNRNEASSKSARRVRLVDPKSTSANKMKSNAT